MNQNQLAYLSGLLDADGFIGLDDGLLYNLKPCVRSGVTTRKVCRWLQVHFGGELYPVPRADGTKVYYWKLTGPEAEQLSQRLSHQLCSLRHSRAYLAGLVDAKGFEAPIEDAADLGLFLAQIKPYLVERKQQANEILQAL